MEDDEQARAERARKLREEIEQLAKQAPGGRRPHSPRDYIEEKMRERPPGEKPGDEEDEQDEPTGGKR